MKISDGQWTRIWWRQWLLISSFLINWLLFYFLAATYAWPSLSAVENIIYFFIGGTAIAGFGGWLALATNPLLRVLKLHVSDLQGIEDKFGWQVEEFDVRSNEITVAQYVSIGRMHRLTDLKLET